VKKLVVISALALAFAFACLWPERRLQGLQCDHNLECLDGYVCVDFYCVAEGVISDAGRRPRQSCEQAFSEAPGYALCQETAESCAFHVTVGAAVNCRQVCRAVDVECLGAERSDVFEPCVGVAIDPNDPVDPNDPNEPVPASCTSTGEELICTCERPLELVPDAALPDAAMTDVSLTDGPRPDTLLPDTQRPDSLRPDTLLPDSSVLATCNQRYNAAPGFHACQQTVSSCEFFQTSGLSCNSVCAGFGGTCQEAHGYSGSAPSCVRLLERACSYETAELICVCSRPPTALIDASLPDNLLPDTLLPDTLLPDTLLPDTLLPDTLLPDTLQPDTLQPDTLQPDTLLPDTRLPDAPLPDGQQADPA